MGWCVNLGLNSPRPTILKRFSVKARKGTTVPQSGQPRVGRRPYRGGRGCLEGACREASKSLALTTQGDDGLLSLRLRSARVLAVWRPRVELPHFKTATLPPLFCPPCFAAGRATPHVEPSSEGGFRLPSSSKARTP